MNTSLGIMNQTCTGKGIMSGIIYAGSKYCLGNGEMI